MPNHLWFFLLIPLLHVEVSVASVSGRYSEEDLSGGWQGVRRIRQIGDCATLDKKEKVSFEAEARSDGEFSLTLVVANPSSEGSPMVFKGRILDDLQITGLVTRRANCQGVNRVYDSDYTGSIRRKKKRIVLELTGRELVCPDMGCEFEHNYRLEKKISPDSSD